MDPSSRSSQAAHGILNRPGFTETMSESKRKFETLVDAQCADDSRCAYKGAACPEPRAITSRGRVLRLCEHHRHLANESQRRHREKKRRQRSHVKDDNSMTKLAPSRHFLTHAPAFVVAPSLDLKCRYRRCKHIRATKRNGDLHSFCQAHREQANAHQHTRRFKTKQRAEEANLLTFMPTERDLLDNLYESDVQDLDLFDSTESNHDVSLLTQIDPSTDNPQRDAKKSATASEITADSSRDCFTGEHNLQVHGLSDRIKTVQPSVREDPLVADEFGMTPLMYASVEGNEPVVHNLLTSGANPYTSSDVGSTALMLASGRGNVRIVALLLKYLRKDSALFAQHLNACDVNGDSALVLAFKREHFEIFYLLLRNGARMNAFTSDLNTSWSEYQRGALDAAEQCQKRQRYYHRYVAITTGATSFMPAKALELIPLVTSVFDLRSLITVINMCEDLTTQNSLVTSTFEHVRDSDLLYDKRRREFFNAMAKHCTGTHIQPVAAMAPSECTSANTVPRLNPEDIYLSSVSNCVREEVSAVIRNRSFIAQFSSRVKNLRLEVNACEYALKRLESCSHLSTVSAFKEKLQGIKNRLEGGIFGVSTREFGDAKRATSVCDVVTAVASVIFPPVLPVGEIVLINFADPVDILRRIYHQEDVPHFLAEEADESLSTLIIRHQLEHHLIAPSSFEILLREAIILKYPEYWVQCTERGDVVSLDGGQWEAMQDLLPDLEQIEESMLENLSEVLSTLDSVWLKARAKQLASPQLPNAIVRGRLRVRTRPNSQHDSTAEDVVASHEVTVPQSQALSAATVASQSIAELKKPRARRDLINDQKHCTRKCSVSDCSNYTISKGLCFRHGGGKKCSSEGCSASAKIGGLCWKHGGSTQCAVEGCERRSKSRGLCWAHSGGTQCRHEDCTKLAVSNGFCWRHDGGKRCVYDGCNRPGFERTMNYCLKHFESFENEACMGTRSEDDPAECESGCTDMIHPNSACIGGGAGMFRAIVNVLRGRSRVRPFDRSLRSSSKEGNAVATFTKEFISSTIDEEIIHYCKGCVVGCTAVERANFIRSVANSGDSSSASTLFDRTNWTFHENDKIDDAHARRYDVELWSLPDGEGLEAVQTLVFSDSTIFFVCIDRSLSGCTAGFTPQCNSKESHWVQLIHSRHPLACIIFVDMQSFSAPSDSLCVDSRTVLHDMKTEIVKCQQGFALSGLQHEIVKGFRSKRLFCGDTTADQSLDFDKSNELLTSNENFHALLKHRFPLLDETTYTATLNVLHQLGEVYHFDGTIVEELEGFVCTDVEVWLEFVVRSMEEARVGGRIPHSTVANLNVPNTESIMRMKQSLTASLLAVPPNECAGCDSDLIVPAFLDAEDETVTPTSLALPNAQPGSFRWARSFKFSHAYPGCLFSQVLVACVSKLGDSGVTLQLNRHHLKWRVGEDTVLCVSSVVRASARSDGNERSYCIHFEAIGVKQPRSVDRIMFQELSCAIEVVLDRYPGLKVAREDASWKPPEWAYEDMAHHLETKPRLSEALAIDENLYTDKVCVVGQRHWGKTTLVQSLTSSLPSLHHEKRTVGVDLVGSSFLEKDERKTFGRRHAVTFVDCAGQAKHQSIQLLFYRHTTLFVICVDLHAYATALEQAQFVCDDEQSVIARMNRFVKHNILRWVDKILLNKPDAQIVFVGTKADKLGANSTRTASIPASFFRHLEAHRDKHTGAIHDRIMAMVNAHAKYSMQSTCQTEQINPRNWFFVSCTSRTAVSKAQRELENLIIRGRQSLLLPKTYARVLTSIMNLRNDFSSYGHKKRVNSTILASKQLFAWVHSIVPSVRQFADKREQILDFLHDSGEVLRYKDIDDPELSNVDKEVLDPQLLVDFARELFSYKCSNEKLPHIALEDLNTFPLWASVKSEPVLLEMKLLLRSFRIVHQARGTMKRDSDLLVPAYWKHAPSYENLNVGPKYLRLERCSTSNHQHHVQWKYYLGEVLDDGFFERVALESYSALHKRRTIMGLIQYTADEEAALQESGRTERQYCQVWIDQKSDDDSRYMVCVEAVASTAFVERIWDPFLRTCIAIEKVLSFHAQSAHQLYVMEGSDEHKVQDIIDELLDRSTGSGLSHNLTWMPPNLEWYVDQVRKLKTSPTSTTRQL